MKLRDGKGNVTKDSKSTMRIVKSILDHFADLPAEHKDKAIANANALYGDEAKGVNVDSLTEALNIGFLWGDTPEGTDYWVEVYKTENQKNQ